MKKLLKVTMNLFLCTAMFAALTTQAAPAAASLTTGTDTLIDARPYLVIRSVEPGAKVDTLTNPGILFLVK